MTRTWTMGMNLDMGRVHSEPVLGRRRQRGEWAGWRDTDKMPPKSPFVPD